MANFVDYMRSLFPVVTNADSDGSIQVPPRVTNEVQRACPDLLREEALAIAR